MRGLAVWISGSLSVEACLGEISTFFISVAGKVSGVNCVCNGEKTFDVLIRIWVLCCGVLKFGFSFSSG